MRKVLHLILDLIENGIDEPEDTHHHIDERHERWLIDCSDRICNNSREREYHTRECRAHPQTEHDLFDDRSYDNDEECHHEESS